MSATYKNYTVFCPTNPLVNKMSTLFNPALKPSSLVKYKPGGCVLPETFNTYYDEVQQFPVEDSDIWVIGFPKTGNSWVDEMIWMINNNYDFEGAEKPQIERVPFFETSGVIKNLRDVVTDPSFYGPTNVSSFQIAQKMSPRIIKTHLPLNLLPAKLRNGERRPRIVYLSRHPKDTVVSFYHHAVLFFGYTGSLDDIVELFTSDLTVWAPYWTHVREFWERRLEPNFFFLKNEDMHQDLSKVIHEVAHFLNVPLPNEIQLKSLLEHLSLDAMKSNPYVNKDDQTNALINVHGVERKTHYIRKGKSGGWKEELSPAAIQMLDKWIENHGIDELYGKDL